MVDISDPLTKIRLTCGTCTGTAILTTIFRNFIRIRKSELWVDDALAVLSMFALIIQLVATFLNPNSANGVLRYYLMSTMFYASIWSARLSILFSIIRITRTFRSNRYLHYLAVAFTLAWAFLTAQIFWVCQPRTAWKHTASPQCQLSDAVAICQLISKCDVISDGILLLVPIRMLIIIRDKKLRYRLTIIFGTCIITTIVSFAHAVYLFEVKEVSLVITAMVENAVSLIVCNIPIMVTAFLKFQQQGSDVPTTPSLSHVIWFRSFKSTTQPTDTALTAINVDVRLPRVTAERRVLS